MSVPELFITGYHFDEDKVNRHVSMAVYVYKNTIHYGASVWKPTHGAAWNKALHMQTAKARLAKKPVIVKRLGFGALKKHEEVLDFVRSEMYRHGCSSDRSSPPS
jgi:hypothetical protein